MDGHEPEGVSDLGGGFVAREISFKTADQVQHTLRVEVNFTRGLVVKLDGEAEVCAVDGSAFVPGGGVIVKRLLDTLREVPVVDTVHYGPDGNLVSKEVVTLTGEPAVDLSPVPNPITPYELVWLYRDAIRLRTGLDLWNT